MEHGYTMAVIATKYPSLGPNVNTEEDLQTVRKILAEEKEKNKSQ